MRRARLGNGLITQASFSDYSGRLTTLAGGPDNGAGLISNSSVQNDSYLYDALSNLSLRTQLIDSSGALSMESFGYDALNRLSTGQVVGQSAKSFSYDAIGNLLSKSGVGSYSYPASGSTSVRPHAVSAITGSVRGVANPSFSYDGNGNFSAGAGRSVSWKSFNAPYVISQGVASVTFAYGPEQQRAKQTVSSGTVITYGGAIEKEQSGSSTKIKTYVRGLGFIEESGSSAVARYFHRDHLGSVSAVSDETGAVLERLSYDAWGKRRLLSGADGPDTLAATIDRTGYSGAEALDPVTLVHLNGRLYDPIVGHLISADPTVSDVSDGQAFNRYAYGLNNPLAYTDPSGYTAIQRNDSPPPKMQEEACIGRIGCIDRKGWETVWALNWFAAGAPGMAQFSGSHPLQFAQATTQRNTMNDAGPDFPSSPCDIPGSFCEYRRDSSGDLWKLIDGQWVGVVEIVGSKTWRHRLSEELNRASEATGLGLGWALDQSQALPGGVAVGYMRLLGNAGRAARAADLAKESIGATGKLGENALKALGGKSQVFFTTTQGGRYVDQLVNGVAHESKVGYQALTSDISRQIAKDVELMQTGRIEGSTWHFFQSPVTGVGGPSQPLMDALRQSGINVIIH